MQFHPVTLDANTIEERQIISLHRSSPDASREVLSLYPRKELYKQGLESSHKPTVDMNTVITSMSTLINLYVKLGKMDEVAWVNITGAYKPFIWRKLKWQAIKSFLEEEDEWV